MIKGLEEFLAVFGKVTITDAVMVILAVVFLVLVYKKVGKYFEDKAEAKKKKDAELKEALTAARTYPEYRQQSLEIQAQLTDSITRVDDALHSIAITVDENEVKRLKGELLNFGNSLRRGERHTYEDFQYIIEVHDDYERLLGKLKRTNGVVTETFGYIMSVYRELLDEGTFSERKV